MRFPVVLADPFEIFVALIIAVTALAIFILFFDDFF